MKQIRLQRYVLRFIFTSALFILIAAPLSRSSAQSADLQQKMASLKQSIAANQQALHQYTWTETMATAFKGETKSTKQSRCQYGPSGTVEKTPLAGAAPPPSDQHGIKGRMIEKKKDEMQDYMQRVAELIKSYVPPNAAQMQKAFQSGKAKIEPSGSGTLTFAFNDYALPGDTVTLTFDTATKKIRGYNVNTYLDAPADVVTLKVVFGNLADGTNHVTQSVLDATAKQIQITTTNSAYAKL